MENQSPFKILLCFLLVLVMGVSLVGCKSDSPADSATTGSQSEPSTKETPQTTVATGTDAVPTTEVTPTTEDASVPETEPVTGAPDVQEQQDIYVLFTSDVHCGIDKGFGYAGLKQIKDGLERQGFKTLLVDNGDAIQGEPIGTLTRGEAIIDLMNAVGYDLAIPGNHEFDYGMDAFMKLTERASFPYISCNFTKEGTMVFPACVIKMFNGFQVAFIGVTTPMTLRDSSPKNFQDENGKFIYDFSGDEEGRLLYQNVQNAIDSVRAAGADLVYVMGHLGNEAECSPYTYADVIANTSGIDVLLDGHSHDTETVVMKDKDGREVTRYAVGTKLSCIGYNRISPEGKIVSAGVWTWTNEDSYPELFAVQNDVADMVRDMKEELNRKLKSVAAVVSYDLTINDPVEKDADGKPIRMIRRAETNMGDFCADAYRDQGDADIAFINGGGIRANFKKGNITFEDIINVHPYGNALTVIEVTGQQILDALEWGARKVPLENGGFLQVSGLTYEIDTTIENGCIEDENGMFAGVDGQRRVGNVRVGNEPIDAEKTYTLAGHNYMLLDHGDGFSMFDGAKVLQNGVKLDNQMLIDHLAVTLGGDLGDRYQDPYGSGRIVIKE